MSLVVAPHRLHNAGCSQVIIFYNLIIAYSKWHSSSGRKRWRNNSHSNLAISKMYEKMLNESHTDICIPQLVDNTVRQLLGCSHPYSCYSNHIWSAFSPDPIDPYRLQPRLPHLRVRTSVYLPYDSPSPTYSREFFSSNHTAYGFSICVGSGSVTSRSRFGSRTRILLL
jgi:hypothetical protein